MPNQNVHSVRFYYYDFQTRKLKPKKPYKYKQIVKVCPECKKKFHPTAKQQIYCSKKCTYEHHRKNPSLQTCKKCGKKVLRLNLKGLCTNCDFGCGNVWILINDKWVKKETEPD